MDRDYKQEHELSEMVRENNGCTLHFKYIEAYLFVYSYNPTKDVCFLLGKFRQNKAYENIRNYLHNLNKEKTFEITWRKPGETKEYISYFTACNIENALAKILDRETVLVSQIREMPIS